MCPGVIIPLVQFMGPGEDDEVGYTEQYSTCLKWGYADSIKLLDMPAGQWDIPGINPGRSLVGAWLASGTGNTVSR